MKNAKPKEKNHFFDINKLPGEKGLILLWISMSRIRNRQDADNCLSDIKIFSPSKVVKPLIGVNLIYGDVLYFHSIKPAFELKNSFMELTLGHKNKMEKLLQKNRQDFQIQSGFNYMVWNQLYLGTNDFNEKFSKIKKIYEKDTLFQKYLQDDAQTFERELDEHQKNFFLEEILMFYLVAHNCIKLPNDYIENNQKWILNCYPGRPMKSVIYLAKLNPFKLEWPENPYQNAFYDLESKKLIKYEDVDLETYSVK